MIQPSSKLLQVIAYIYECRGVYYFCLRHRQLLFAAKAYLNKTSGRPYYSHITALAAIISARLNEVAQFQVKEFRITEAGTAYIHINEDDSSLPVRALRTLIVTAVSCWSMALIVLCWLTLFRLCKIIEKPRVMMLCYLMASS